MTSSVVESSVPSSNIQASNIQELPEHIDHRHHQRCASLAASQYKTTIVRSLDVFEQMATEWDLFMEACQEDNINLEHCWLLTYLKHFPPSITPFIILVRNANGELVGAAPLKITRNTSGLFSRLLRCVEFIGGNLPCVYDHIRFPCLPDEDQTAIIQEIANQLLLHQNLWDVIFLKYSTHYDQLFQLVQRLAPTSIYKYKCEQCETMLTLGFPESAKSGDDCITNKSLRKNLSRHHKRIQSDFPGEELKLEIQPTTIHSNQQLDEFFDHLIEYWSKRDIRIDLGRYANLRSFYKMLYQLYPISQDNYVPGRIELSYLKIGNKIISSNLGFWQKEAFLGHLFTYNPEFKKYAPGLIHIQAIIKHTFQHGGKRLDFGRGDESYKNQWGSTLTPLYNLLAYKTPLGFISGEGDELLRQGYHRLKALFRPKEPAQQ